MDGFARIVGALSSATPRVLRAATKEAKAVLADVLAEADARHPSPVGVA